MHLPSDSASAVPPAEGFRPGSFKVLGAFTAVAAVSQMLWLNFAPILTRVETRYGVTELQASSLVLVFPLLYVVLSLPAGALIDRVGYVKPVAAGAIAQALFALLRIADDSFVVLLVAQAGIAIAQPFIVNGIAKLVADWFTTAHGAIANGVGTMGMFLGMAIAMAATPVAVDALGSRGAMVLFGVVSAAAAALFVAWGRERTTQAPAPLAAAARRAGRRDLFLLYAVSFLGLGFFNGLTTWLEAIVAPNGIGTVQAGVLGGVLILGGIVGAAVIPALSDKAGKRKPFVLACATAALVLTYPLCVLGSYPVLLVLGALLGFFFLPAYALLIEMCSELAGAAAAGRATGILMLLGNAGGVVVVAVMPLVKGEATSWRGAAMLLVGLVAACIGLASQVGETFGRSATLAAEAA